MTEPQTRTKYCYDPLNRVTGKAYTAQTCANGLLPSPLVSYYYDQSSYSGLTISNGIGLRTGMSDQAGAEAWSYDSMGRPLVDQRTTNGLTKSTNYVYLPYVDGSVNTITYPSGRTLTYSTGAAERRLSAQDSSTSVYYANAAHYAPPGALSSLTNGAALYSTQLYNSRLQPCWIYTTTGTALPSNTACTASDPTPGNILDLNYNFNFGSSDNGNVTGITNNRDTTRSQSFAYDSLNRIATAESTSTYATSPSNCWGESYFFDNNSTSGQGAWGNLTSTSAPSTAYNGCIQESNLSVIVAANNQLSQSSNFCYDSAGNLVLETSCPTGSFTPTYSFDAENHLVSTAGVNYVYDANGNTLTKTVGSNTTSYTWDYENRLTSVTLPGSGGTVTFKYDPFGRRIYKSSSSGTSIYAYDGDDVVEETNASGGVVARYTHTTDKIDEPVAMLRSGATSYYHADGLGSITSLSSTAGALAQTYTFDSFGKQISSSGSLVNPFQFTSREFDTETNLYYFRERYYDPQPGRFLSEDPAFFDAGVDFYTYVRNNPINFTDPSGLYTTSPEVPLPLPPALDKFMKCMDGCTGREQHVNATTNGKHSDPGHAAGTTVDIRPVGTPSQGPNGVYCCAGKCGAPYLLDERKLKTKYGAGPHYHIQLVPPAHPSPNAPNSIPDTPECKPGKKC